ncbi:hypothetical protein GC197_06925 [bacterium]|nr:hypothetical protein [bacterium]
MTTPADDPNWPAYLRINQDDDSPNRPRILLRTMGVLLAAASLAIAVAPLFFPNVSSSMLTAYLLCLAFIVGLDVCFVGLLLTWRTITRSRLGEWVITIESFQSSIYRNLLLGGGLHIVSIFLLWIPLLSKRDPNPSLQSLGLFVVLSAMGALAAMPWLVQFFLNIRGNDLEVHEEGMMIGGFYPCRWNRIVQYSVWDDAASLVVLDIRGRGPVEVFMAPGDRKILVEILKEHVGPPTREGRSDDLPDDHQQGQFGNLSVFR